MTPSRIAAPYLGGRIELDFVTVAGTVRDRKMFVGIRVPAAAQLRLPALGGHADIGFIRLAEGWLISTRVLSTVVHGACIEVESAGLTRRLVLRRGADPNTGSTRW